MLPHERSLVKKLESKPFVLVAVDSDPDRAKFKETAAKEEVTWPAFWDESTHAWSVEPGTVTLSIGSSSTLIRSSTTLTVQ